MKKYYMALDLIDDIKLIEEYEQYHKKSWPEITSSIYDAGINNMEIYRVSNRLFMIIEAEDSFTFEHKAALDAQNKKVQEWEELMWQYQQRIPGAGPGEKWLPMTKIFQLRPTENNISYEV